MEPAATAAPATAAPGDTGKPGFIGTAPTGLTSGNRFGGSDLRRVAVGLDSWPRGSALLWLLWRDLPGEMGKFDNRLRCRSEISSVFRAA